MLASCPNTLLIKVTLITLSEITLSVITLAHEFRDTLAALRRNVVGRAEFSQSIHGGAHHVDGIAGSIALGQDVANPGALEYRTHAAAGDDAGAVGGRLHVYPRGSMPPFDSIKQGFVLQRYGNQALAGLHHRLGYRDRHFARLAVAKTDAPGAVAHHGQRSEAELLAALDHLGHTVHRDQLLEQVIAGHWFFYSRHSVLLDLFC